MGLVEEFGACVVDIEPIAPDRGVACVEDLGPEEAEELPARWRPAIREGIERALERGPSGFPVVGVSVRLVGGRYDMLSSTEDHFVHAGELAVQRALEASGTAILEPLVHADHRRASRGHRRCDHRGRRLPRVGSSVWVATRAPRAFRPWSPTVSWRGSRSGSRPPPAVVADSVEIPATTSRCQDTWTARFEAREGPAVRADPRAEGAKRVRTGRRSRSSTDRRSSISKGAPSTERTLTFDDNGRCESSSGSYGSHLDMVARALGCGRASARKHRVGRHPGGRDTRGRAQGRPGRSGARAAVRPRRAGPCAPPTDVHHGIRI